MDERDKIETIAPGRLVKLVREGSTQPSSSDGGSVILFPDGDRLYRSVLGPAGETTLEVQSFALGTLSVPLDSLLALILAPPIETDAIHMFISKVREDIRTTEVLWLTNGDRLAGGLLALDDKTIKFQPSTGKVEIDRSGVIAFGIRSQTGQLSSARRSLSRIDDGRWFPSGCHGNQCRRKSVGRLDPIWADDQTSDRRTGSGALRRMGRLLIFPNGFQLSPDTSSYLGPTRPVKADQAIDGQPLRLGGKLYDRGLGTQSRTYLVYRLEPTVQRFQALVGVDDRAGPLGSVVFRVAVDGKETYASPPMSVRDTPKAIDLAIAGAKSLVLITDFGERGEVRDHADWVEARLVK